MTFAARHIPALIDDMRMLPQPEKPIPIWIGGSSEPALKRALAARRLARLASVARAQAAPIARRLRALRPEPEFAISVRSGWDGKDEGALAARLAGYGEAGVGHVLVEPAERTLDDWLAAVERVARAAEAPAVSNLRVR